MNHGDAWSPFLDAVNSPWDYARAWKTRTRGKVVGHLLPDVPEEIIHAAGALPVAVEGAGVQVSRAQAHIPGYTCSHAMGAFDLRLQGELAMLDGMVIPYVCDTTRNLYHIWAHCFPDMTNEFLRLPKRIRHPDAAEYLIAEFTRFLDSMKGITSREVGADALAASVDLYNRSRSRLRQAYKLHQTNPSVWTAERLHAILASAPRIDREAHLAWMEALPWDAEPVADSGDRIRLYVRGKVWDPPGILRMLDELGFVIAGDEVVTGFRGIQHDANPAHDPVVALAQRHLATIPYAGYHLEPTEIVQSFMTRVQDSAAAGVLFLNPKFCEAAAFDTPDLQAALQNANIPSLVLETSARGVSPGQIRLRLEAFQEMLSGDLP
jgi:benzoyl-CoA reductase subunit C